MDNPDIAVDLAQDHLGTAPSAPPERAVADRVRTTSDLDVGSAPTRATLLHGGTLLGNPRRVRL